jgi:hypothetical protein
MFHSAIDWARPGNSYPFTLDISAALRGKSQQGSGSSPPVKGRSEMLFWQNRLKLEARKLKRLPMNLMLRGLLKWEPQGAPAAGYSVAIACMRELASVAVANLRMCAGLNTSRMHELILVFDCPVDQIPAMVVDAARAASSSINVELLGYDESQYRVARRINWGWVYSWMSWCLAIRRARTRAVIIHDLDALPINADVFEQIYDHWAEEATAFCGIRTYVGAGVTEEMGLVTTFELALDAAYVRRRFQPFDLFSKLKLVGGRIVDFDTMLYAQWQSPRRAVRPINESQLVHPSQLICHYTDLISGRSNFRNQGHMLPALVYFMYLGGDTTPLTTTGWYLAEQGAQSFRFFGRTAYIDGVKPGHWAWMEKQIRRVEQACFGNTRPEVEDYLRGFIQRSGSSRTVGKESGPTAIADL